MIRVIGIDVGTATTGWSIIDRDPQATNKLRLVEYGAIITRAHQSAASRLVEIYDQITDIIDKFRPSQIAIESLYYFKNQTTVMSVSQARGVILLAAEKAHLEIYEYTPLQVKSAVTGYGRAEKKQVQQMVKMILGMKEIPKPDDAADAIAIGVTHIHSIDYISKIKKQHK